MAGTMIGGVRGVLGNLVSSAPAHEMSPRQEHSCTVNRPSTSVDRQESGLAPSQRARLGRPPRGQAPNAGLKEKVTLRIPSDLIAEYRDWSWEARCQLSELATQALDSYRQTRHR